MDYNDIYSTDPSGLNMGAAAPTVSQAAVVAGAGNAGTGYSGIVPPTVTGAPVVTPPVAGVGGTKPAGPGFFAQGGIGQFALGAIQTLGSLWNSYQQNKLAKESFKFQKEAYATNLENQEQSYNTALEDRINARYVTEGKSQAEADAYITEHSL